jgi:tetratricopeptide (TPR) repeat protein/predicted Ser/Thr protein kinase
MAPGTLFGRYVVVRPIARGGMGAVALAYDSQLERRVAIKVLLTAAEPEEARARMLREAQAMAQLSHPNVVGIYDVGTQAGDIFLAMEFVDGVPMSEWLSSPRSIREVLTTMKLAGRGLAAAHAAGIVHRDFKPGNVLIGHDGRVCVVDFGIARATHSPSSDATSEPIADASTGRAQTPPPAWATSATTVPAPPVSGPELPTRSSGHLTDPITVVGQLVGTVGYMAPEQMLGEADARADVFAFAVTLWRGLFGASPFPGRSIPDYYQAVMAGPVRRARSRRVPGWLEGVVRKGLAADPAERFASMDAMLAALEADPTPKRRWAVVGVLTVAGILAGAGVHVARGHAAQRACLAEADEVGAAWSPSRRDAVGQAMLAAGGPFAAERASRVTDALDTYASSWRGEEASSCEATRVAHTQPPGVHDQRSLCLLADRQALESVSDLLATADPTVERQAFALVQALAPPRLCSARLAGSTSPLPRGADARAMALEGRRLTAQAAILEVAGRGAEALDALGRALSLAEGARDAAGQAEALRQRARQKVIDGKGEEATKELVQAIAVAERAGEERVASLSASNLAFLIGERSHAFDSAEPWQELARAKLDRIGDDPMLAYNVLFTDAELAWLVPDGAARAFELWGKVLEQARAVYGDATQACVALNNRGVAAWMNLDVASAVQAIGDAVDCERRVNGEHSNRLVFNYINQAEYLAAQGRLDEALVAARLATELRRAADPAGGAGSPLLGLTRGSEAMVLGLMGRFADAEEAARDARRYAERRPEDVPFVLYTLGVARAGAGDPRGAQEACEEAVEKQDALERPAAGKPYEYDALRCAGEAYLALGDVPSARARLERSVTLVRRPFPGDLALARFALARALLAGPTPERARGLRLAEEAMTELETAVRTRASLAARLRELEAFRRDPP